MGGQRGKRVDPGTVARVQRMLAQRRPWRLIRREAGVSFCTISRIARLQIGALRT